MLVDELLSGYMFEYVVRGCQFIARCESSLLCCKMHNHLCITNQLNIQNTSRLRFLTARSEMVGYPMEGATHNNTLAICIDI